MSDSIIIRKVRAALQRLYDAASQIEGFRKERFTYQFIKNWYKDDELRIMSKALGYPAVTEKDLTDENRRKRSYKRLCWFYALNPFSPTRINSILRSAVALGLAPIEYAMAIGIYFIRKIYGERVAESVFPKPQ